MKGKHFDLIIQPTGINSIVGLSFPPPQTHNLTTRVFRLISLITKQWEATEMQMGGLGFPGHPT